MHAFVSYPGMRHALPQESRRLYPWRGRTSTSRLLGRSMPQSSPPGHGLESDAADAHERPAYARATAPDPAAPIAPPPSAPHPDEATAGDVAIVTPSPDTTRARHEGESAVKDWLLEGHPQRM